MIQRHRKLRGVASLQRSSCETSGGSGASNEHSTKALSVVIVYLHVTGGRVSYSDSALARMRID
jgi:hypothetical protein